MGADPLFVGGVDGGIVFVVLFKVVLVFALLMVAVMLMIWFERKLVGDMQNRFGPNRAGPYGLLQTLADGIKLFFKEDLLPTQADRRVFRLAPYLALIPAFLTFAVVPVGGVFDGERDGTVSLFGNDTYFQVADPPVGVLFILAMSSIAVYGVMLAGWSSGSKYPLLGSVRASAQMISYEAALGLSVITVVFLTGSLSTHDIVAAQAGEGFSGFIPNWHVIRAGFVPFVVFLIAGTAELNRPPFDLVEAEQEIVGGYHTEYSSLRFAMFFLAEFMNVITMSAIIVTLFLGGPAGPLLGGPDFVWPIVWFALKVYVLLFVFVWMRSTLPRFRYDQLMDLGWKRMIPLSLAWLLLIAAIQIFRNQNNDISTIATVFVLGMVGLGAAFGLIGVAIRRGAEAAEEVSA
ncbi:MAG TPA: NADH-quinone oxidoreductase subunit NuoH [Acidimicrobiales bacterium]